ncbi:hypothetical protein KXD40_009470 [Peronospora effusa]|uniref:Steroid 5-alpha reductase C-terminal domain-containing protein n=1 Tax=Peronospora effusa TaxID=542832 RepID=A0A425C650_9STRA|nr:hypothetical protein DD237_008068 [Peronospora effusa]UIZ28521.1 hypothetical protein KXD40_009470 [Peronospora effusa]
MDEPLVSGGIMLLICLAYTCQFDKVTDLAGSLNFIVLAVLSLVLQDVFDTRAIVVTCMQVTWAIRLGSFLLLRVLKRGKDERFDKMRANCMAFFGFWVFQILWVFLVSLPVVLANSCGGQINGRFGKPRDIIGIVIWTIGMVVEYAADASKSAFHNEPKNKGKLLHSGMTIIASANFGSNGGETWFYYVSCISPTLTFVLLIYLSGVPLAEDRYDERFGLDSNYLEYKRSTSPLIILPPSIYRSIPAPIKRWCFFELERYSRKLRELRDTEHKTSHTNYQAIS